MIEICPAILESDKVEFTRQLNEYANHFKSIDIDLNLPNDSFYGKVTVDPEFACNEITRLESSPFIRFHLMIDDIAQVARQIQHTLFKSNQYKDLEKYMLIVHQEIDFDPAELEYNRVGVAVKSESKMKEIDFYAQFEEVQLMTIKTGEQGNPFQPEILQRAEWLREQGFTGVISVDGSINDKTAPEVAKHSIDRVSVGSYFSKSEDVGKSLDVLQKLLV